MRRKKNSHPERRLALAALCGALALALASGSLLSAGTADGESGAPSPKGGRSALSLVIGAADVHDAFYSAGNALSNFFAAHTEHITLDLSVQVTTGSVFNAQSVISGDMDIGFTQSAAQAAAVEGRGPWEGMGPQKSLRSICSLFTGALMLIVFDSSPIRSLEDLAGRRVGVGTPGSGSHMNARDLLDFPGHAAWADTVERVEAPVSQGMSMLIRGELDAIFINSGHPAETVRRLIREAGRPLRFVPIDRVPRFLRHFPEYVPHYIPLATYPGIANAGQVRTIGAPTTLVTTEAMPEDVGYRIARTLYEGFDDLRVLHPAFADITRADMLVGLEAPLQEGSDRYFRDVGATRARGGASIEDKAVLLAATPEEEGYNRLTRRIIDCVNRDWSRHGVRVFTMRTEGSVDNINRIVSGTASFGLASGQSLRDAVRATDAWKGGVPQRKLRSLGRMGSDSYFFVAALDAIRSGRLAPGIRIAVGRAGSGEEAAARDLLAGIPGADEAQFVNAGNAEARRMLVSGEADAILFTVFHEGVFPPAELGRQLWEGIRYSERPLRFIPLSPDGEFLANSGFYESQVTIPPAAPGESERTLATLTTPIVFFTSVDIPKHVVSAVCAAFLDGNAFGGADSELDPEYAFSALPIRIHDAMLDLVRERTGHEPVLGPSPYETYLMVGSGTPDSDFSLAAGALTAIVNRNKAFDEPLLVVRPTENGADNIERLAAGDHALCLAEGIKALDAFTGRGEWSGRPFGGLRQLGVLYVSSLVALVDDGDPVSAGLRDITNLEGLRVSLPAGYDVARDNAISIFSSANFSKGLGAHTLLAANEKGGLEVGIDLLRRGAVKSLLFTSGAHPNESISLMMKKARLRPLSVSGIHNLLVNDKGYTTIAIPADAYSPADADAADIQTLGIPVMLLATEDLPDSEAYRIASRLAEQLEAAAGMFPAFTRLAADLLPRDDVPPLHEGARRAYRDAGLLLDRKDLTVQNVSIAAVTPYSEGRELAGRLSGEIMRRFQTFRAHVDVSNSMDLSAALLANHQAEFAVFPVVAVHDPETEPLLRDFRAVSWFGDERFVCIARADSPFTDFFDLTGGTIGVPEGLSSEGASYDTLCRILRPVNPPKKTAMHPNSFMAALLGGRLDAAILTADRLERWLERINMTAASKRFKFLTFSARIDDNARRRLAAMKTGVGTHRFTVSGGRVIEAPVYRVANVMLASPALPMEDARRIAWVLDPDNPGVSLHVGAPGRPAGPGEAPGIWRDLPLPLHDGVEEYLRERLRSGEAAWEWNGRGR